MTDFVSHNEAMTHIAGLVIRCLPENSHSLIESFKQLPDMDLAGSDSQGHIVLVVECDSEASLSQRMAELTEYSGVISVSLSYYHAEPSADLDSPMQAEPDPQTEVLSLSEETPEC